MKLIFASNNAHKLREIKKLIPSDYVLLTLNDINCTDELPETENTIEANALQKANYVFDKYNLNCFADDSGLEIEELKGAPGVHSAYYAGLPRNDEKNFELVLKELQQKQNRNAQFKTIIAFVKEGKHFLFEGIIKGTIAESSRGTNGFGYDPIFIPEGYNQTLAELSPEEKNKISHRATAVKMLVAFLK